MVMVKTMNESPIPIVHKPDASSSELLATALEPILKGEVERAQVLVPRGTGSAAIARFRVALSRSRARNRKHNRKINHFTLNHSIYPYTDKSGERFDAVVLSIQKRRRHRAIELIDDMLERGALPAGVTNVP